MAVPSGDYFENEYGDGCSYGLVRVFGVMAVIAMMYMLVSKANQNGDIHQVPRKEIRTNVDTCPKITDTFNIKTR